MPNFSFVRDNDGNNQPPNVIELPVADSQTLAVGDAVVLSSNKIAKAGASFGECVGVMAEAITTGSSAGGPLAKVYVAKPSQLWRATASANATSHVLGVATYDLNSSQVVNVADTTGGCIQIVALNDSTTDILIRFDVCALA
jgi:hypothetical protein